MGVAPPQNQPVNGTQIPTNQTSINGSIIDAGLFLTGINLIFPLMIVFCNNYFSDDKIDPKQLKLKDEQIKDLKQVCQDALKQVNLTGNPIVILLVLLCSAFAVNFMAIKMDIEIKKIKTK
jgi:hypothetical protein